MSAKFYPDQLRFGSTKAKNLFCSKNRERPSISLVVNKWSKRSAWKDSTTCTNCISRLLNISWRDKVRHKISEEPLIKRCLSIQSQNDDSDVPRMRMIDELLTSTAVDTGKEEDLGWHKRVTFLKDLSPINVSWDYHCRTAEIKDE